MLSSIVWTFYNHVHFQNKKWIKFIQNHDFQVDRIIELFKYQWNKQYIPLQNVKTYINIKLEFPVIMQRICKQNFDFKYFTKFEFHFYSHLMISSDLFFKKKIYKRNNIYKNCIFLILPFNFKSNSSSFWLIPIYKINEIL